MCVCGECFSFWKVEEHFDDEIFSWHETFLKTPTKCFRSRSISSNRIRVLLRIILYIRIYRWQAERKKTALKQRTFWLFLSALHFKTTKNIKSMDIVRLWKIAATSEEEQKQNTLFSCDKVSCRWNIYCKFYGQWNERSAIEYICGW